MDSSVNFDFIFEILKILTLKSILKNFIFFVF